MGSVFQKPDAARGIFQAAQRLNQEAAAAGIHADRGLIADLMDDALAQTVTRRLVLIALADFVLLSLDGATPDPY